VPCGTRDVPWRTTLDPTHPVERNRRGFPSHKQPHSMSTEWGDARSPLSTSMSPKLTTQTKVSSSFLPRLWST
jgi:hypothetical protein